MKLLCFLLFFSSFVKSETIFTCLGKEEEKIHISKIKRLHYHLNQSLISLFMKHAANISINKRNLERFCSSEHPSLKLLQIVLLDPNFISEKSSGGKTEFISEINQLFLSAISIADQYAPSHYCLNQYLPGLKKLKEKMRHFSSDIDPVTIIKKQNSLSKIIYGLSHLDQYYQQCQEDLSRLKKKK